MKRNYRQWTFSSLLVLLLAACVTDYMTPPKFQQEGRLVVEGFITGDTENEFILSRSVPLAADSAFQPETGARLTIRCNNGDVFGPAKEVEPGKYRIPMGRLDASAQYRLEFQTGGETYESEYLQPTFSPEIDSIHWNKAGKGQPLEIYVSTHDEQNSEGYYLWTFQEDWEFTSTLETHWFYNPETYSFYEEKIDPYYFCWNKKNSTKILIASTEDLTENRIVNQPIHSISPDDIRISFLYCITVQQKTLSKKGYQYYKEKQTLNETMGGIFSPQPLELKGNIVCTTNPETPVIGFIDVAHIAQKRVFIQPDGIYEYKPRECTELWPKFGSYELTYYAMYRMGYRPIITRPGSIPDYWINKGCRECTELGTKNKPDFWPNNHQ